MHMGFTFTIQMQLCNPQELIVAKYGLDAANVGDEGGFAPPCDSFEAALDLLVAAIEQAGYTGKIKVRSGWISRSTLGLQRGSRSAGSRRPHAPHQPPCKRPRRPHPPGFNLYTYTPLYPSDRHRPGELRVLRRGQRRRVRPSLQVHAQRRLGQAHERRDGGALQGPGQEVPGGCRGFVFCVNQHAWLRPAR